MIVDDNVTYFTRSFLVLKDFRLYTIRQPFQRSTIWHYHCELKIGARIHENHILDTSTKNKHFGVVFDSFLPQYLQFQSNKQYIWNQHKRLSRSRCLSKYLQYFYFSRKIQLRYPSGRARRVQDFQTRARTRFKRFLQTRIRTRLIKYFWTRTRNRDPID